MFSGTGFETRDFVEFFVIFNPFIGLFIKMCEKRCPQLWVGYTDLYFKF